MVTRRGTADAAEFVFRVFRRQQQERFLPGLEKLGLSHLPPAVAAAQYHYLSNWIGGVHVEYMYETDRKAWIRYPPPRWIWRGTAICGVPGEVSRAMLRGWHANNGVALGNLKLGFVCTKQSVDGQDGLEGYYCEYDHPLELDQRLVFARHLEAPLFDPAAGAGVAGRELAKAAAGKSLSQLRDGICADRRARDGAIVRPRGCRLSAAPHRQADRHAVFRRDRAAVFGVGRGGAKEFAAFLRALFEAQDDVAEISEIRRRVRNPAAELEADGRCRRLSPGLRQRACKDCSRASPPAAAAISPCI